MRLTVHGGDYAVAVVPKLRTRRVSIRAGPVILTVSPAEAFALADALVEAAETLRSTTVHGTTQEGK
ncbi:hypothetical protein MKUB_29120 [Mycobacterium kubicae]|uniref:Uncharacterized protein n=1 Tax=Mycobacterium kubicae TaxID=120959 RepID=A0ABQ1BLG4_9MYCO|nr:hypothetical protein AWC13_02510 [Mycobacterium kubicae]GFG62802.1 hypothetical protein MKUB_02920 [Mycobacterium kubicae]GFG64567.1 hypothetical protein MKUB_20570 [Mycobacterium kubicae]GFG65395.1 hypothetical protein MKUB_28850 [Mycobacterium kubicae]GFG65422.1 hypothetical protein MKUB_29120 [Mycobacterium kubicae]